MKVKVTIDHQVSYIYSWYPSSRNLVVSGAYLDLLISCKTDGKFSGVDTVCVLWDGHSKERLLCALSRNEEIQGFIPLLWLREVKPHLEIGWIDSSRAAFSYLKEALLLQWSGK
jgi:hypothetical protein